MEIPMFRGDTKKLKFQRMSTDGTTILERAEMVFFTVKKNTSTKDVLIQKTIEDMSFDEEGWYHFRIESEETDDLAPGSYVFDVQVNDKNSKQTVCFGTLTIKPEVTFVSNEV